MSEEIKNYENISDEDFEFDVTTVADCIQEKIPPSSFIPEIQGVKFNMRWTEIIAMINRKNKTGKRINTQIPVGLCIKLYMKLVGKSFLAIR